MEENQSNINDIFSKFNSILKEKNINLGEILGDNTCNNEKNDPLDFDFDLDTILKFKNIYQKINNQSSPITRLLCDLKPFLKGEKKEKIDQIIKIVKLIGVISIMNEGM